MKNIGKKPFNSLILQNLTFINNEIE